jgi:hypothetical protein
VQPPSTPTLLYSLAGLEEQLKAAYKLVTEGKFSESLKVFNRMLHTIPLVVVETRKEVRRLLPGACLGLGCRGCLGCCWCCFPALHICSSLATSLSSG